MNNAASPKMYSFKDYFFGTLFRPRRTFDILVTDNRRLKFGLLAISINALYILLYISFCPLAVVRLHHSRPGWQFLRMHIITTISSFWLQACLAVGFWQRGLLTS